MAAVLLACGASIGGCWNSSAVETDDPERSFAPLVLLAPGEPWRPLSAHQFIQRSVLWFAEDQGCADRKIAVGRTLPEQRTNDVNWIAEAVLGSQGDWGWAYYRNPYDAKCENDIDRRAYADQHVRPFDRVDRPAGIHPGEGFYLDLTDAGRRGERSLDRATIYSERRDEGDSTVRLSYWLLFGMNATPGPPSETHEGDWERLEVVLRRDGDGEYEPRSVRLGTVDMQGAPAQGRQLEWRDVELADGTHPVLLASRGDHALRAAPNAGTCKRCERWRTWSRVARVRKQPWFGYGGAWGTIGTTGANTGPLGPHGKWGPDYQS